MLFRRKRISALEVIEHLVGMQSQLPNSPYVGLWSRLVKFDQSELADLYRARKVVRIAMMRSTIHHRRRIIADAYKSRVYPINGMIQPTGFVEGKWKISANDRKATLSIEAFRRPTKSELASIEEEGESLLAFAAGNAKARDIRVSGP